MCSISVNRRNVYREVRSGEVTGTTLTECATCVVARMGLHPSCRRKVQEKLEELVRGYYVELKDAVLVVVPENERCRLYRQAEEEAARKRRTLSRTADHRSRGVRGLPLQTEEDPDWDPDELTQEELELAAWASQFHTPTPPAGEWDEKDAELTVLIASQRADDAADKNHRPLCVGCGSLHDIAKRLDPRLDGDVDPATERMRLALIR